MPGRIIIISGPSQVGKDAVVKELLKRPALNLARIITVTTREQRPEEVDGIDHYFVDNKEFDARVARGEFLEWAPVRNRKFATPRQAVETALRGGRNVLLKIDVRGAEQVMDMYADAVRIFIEPDSLESIRRRMVEKGFSDEQLNVRWHEAMEELKAAHDYDYRVVNREGKLNETVEKITEVILHLPPKG
ncbi:MAG: guanylate kinase [Patescibacteria group bacterium]